MVADDIISNLYGAAASRMAWQVPFDGIAELLDLWAVQVVGVDKRTGVLIFSGEGGPVTPAAALDYIRFYHPINPRMAPTVATPMGQWMHCHEHFDERYVASSVFYQDFLIPHGGRYLSATKLLETDDALYLLGFMRGYGKEPVGAADMPFLERVTHHLREAFRNMQHIGAAFVELSVARQLLGQFAYPMLLVDARLSVMYTNALASATLSQRDVLGEQGGFLFCHDAANQSRLAQAIDDLELERRPQAVERRVISLERPDGSQVLAFVNSMDPARMMGMFGDKACALVMLHDPLAARTPLDAFIVAECFQLTPAEAKVAIQIAQGATPKEIAQRSKIALPTVRTQLQRVMEKTGTTRQAELMGVLLALPARGVARRPGIGPG